MNQPTAYLFDVFGTIVDWRTGVADYLKPFFDAKQIAFDPFEFADLWRGEYQPSMEKIRSGNRGYVPLDQLHLETWQLFWSTPVSQSNLLKGNKRNSTAPGNICRHGRMRLRVSTC